MAQNQSESSTTITITAIGEGSQAAHTIYNGPRTINCMGHSGCQHLPCSSSTSRMNATANLNAAADSGGQSRTTEVWSTIIIDHKIMDFTSRRIGKKWRHLGRELKCDEHELDDIYLDKFPSGGLRECCYVMLNKFKQRKYKDATVGALLCALSTVEREDIAEHIRINFG